MFVVELAPPSGRPAVRFVVARVAWTGLAAEPGKGRMETRREELAVPSGSRPRAIVEACRLPC